MPEDSVTSSHENNVPDGVPDVYTIPKDRLAKYKEQATAGAEIDGVRERGVSYKVDRDGLPYVEVRLVLKYDLLIGVEKYAKSENFNLRSAIMELVEVGLVEGGWLPKWWRVRRF